MWTVYRCDLIKRGFRPENEIAVSDHATSGEAMDEANRLKRLDRAHSYTVGCNG